MKELPEGYNYRPLPEGLHIKDSEIEGQGLFTKINIPTGINLGKTHILVDNELVRYPLGGHINNSEEPNCVITDLGQLDKPYSYLVPIKDIKAGEELTCNYFKSSCANKI